MTWRKTFHALVLLLIAFNVLLIGLFSATSGWDFAVYCGAVRAAEAGHNPYLVSELRPYTGSDLSFVYPPSSLWLFKVLCRLGNRGYLLWWSAALVPIFALMAAGESGANRWLWGGLLLSGFIAVYFNYFTGNVGLLELLPFALAYQALRRHRYRASAVWLALSAYFKGVPLLFGATYAFLNRSWREKARLWLILGGSFALLLLASYAASPNLWDTYRHALTGSLGTQHSPLRESGGVTNPALPFLVADALRLIGITCPRQAFIVYAALSLWIVSEGVFFIRRHRQDFELAFSVGVLGLLLVLPHLKPYSFTFALLPVYTLARRQGMRGRVQYLLIVSLIPLLLYLLPFALYPRVLPEALRFLWNYGQTLALLTAYGIGLWRDGKSA